MAVTKKKKKGGTITEDDISLLLRKYSAKTILDLLREIYQFPGAKIDWDALVKNTSTGISDVQEYRMLWRHLAYRNALVERVDENPKILDDDSDLDYELDASPPGNDESSNEVAAYTKVLLASGLPNDSDPSTVEAPLTISIPNYHAFRAPLDNPNSSCSQGRNITVPVFVHTQPSATTTTTSGPEGNGLAGGSMPARKKRKQWTAEEDMELIAAVQKFGERNWANIVKGNFKGERTVKQLSQRWSNIRKKNQTNPAASTNTSSMPGSQLSEAQLAARRAVNMALNMPNHALSSVGFTASFNPSSSSAALASTNEVSLVSGAPAEANTKATVGNNFAQQHLNEQTSHQTSTSLPKGVSSTTAKSRPNTKKATPLPVKSPVGPNPLIQAAAVAAGARIATPSTAASLMKAAQSKNAVHIRPGGSSLIRPSMSLPQNNPGVRPNVRYIRTGLTPASQPVPTLPIAVPSIPQSVDDHQSQPVAVKPHLPSTVPASSLPGTSGETLDIKSANAMPNNIKSTNAIPNVVSEISSVEEITIKSVDEEIVKSVDEGMKVDSLMNEVKDCREVGDAEAANVDMDIEKHNGTKDSSSHTQNMEVDEKPQNLVVNCQTSNKTSNVIPSTATTTAYCNS